MGKTNNKHRRQFKKILKKKINKKCREENKTDGKGRDARGFILDKGSRKFLIKGKTRMMQRKWPREEP